MENGCCLKFQKFPTVFPKNAIHFVFHKEMYSDFSHMFKWFINFFYVQNVTFTKSERCAELCMDMHCHTIMHSNISVEIPRKEYEVKLRKCQEISLRFFSLFYMRNILKLNSQICTLVLENELMWISCDINTDNLYFRREM